MNPVDAPRGRLAKGPGPLPGARILLAALALSLFAGCTAASLRRQPPQPGRTTLGAPLVVLPAQLVGNLLIVETKWDRFGPYRFLVDTGSAVTLVSPALARRYPGSGEVPAVVPPVRVRGAAGGVVELPRSRVRRIELGEARFEEVDVLLYDCAPISAHLGIPIDGVLGFPLFREVLLTLDYPGRRLLLRPVTVETPMPGAMVAVDDARKTPLITLRLGGRSLVALIDSGSDAGFSLNPVGVAPRFSFGPREGAVVGTIAGDRRQQVARLGEALAIGDYVFEQPVVDLTDELSAIGGGALRHFEVTFDQSRDRVTFYREGRGPLGGAAVRSAGVSFSKTPAYWRIAGVVPDSPAAAAGIEAGDLVIRIEGESMAKWDLRRFEERVATAAEITLTFLKGTIETDVRVRTFDLVPPP
jgi:hypothetical protein